MALINYASKEINAKIVYYGPGLSGKTTNIQFIYQKLNPEHRGKLITLPTQTDRTLFFDFLPVEIPDVKGFTTRFHLYTVPGQVFYNATRKMVLKGVDGVVFVADSQVEKLDDNIASLKNLEENLNEYGKTLKTIPFVMQFNKRDLKNICEVKEMLSEINKEGYPYYEAIATQGPGVMATLTGISKMALRHIKESYESQKILRYNANEEKKMKIEESLEDEVVPDDHAEVLGVTEEEVLGSSEISTYTGEEIKPETDDLGVMGDYGDSVDDNSGEIEIALDEDEDIQVDIGGGNLSKSKGSVEESTVVGELIHDDKTVEVEIDSGDLSKSPVKKNVEVVKTPQSPRPAAVDLVFGGKVLRIGSSSFKIPLTLRLNDIKKDVVINISLEISDSDKD